MENMKYFRCASRIVNRTGDEDPPLAIDDNGLLIIGHAALYHFTTYYQQKPDQ